MPSPLGHGVDLDVICSETGKGHRQHAFTRRMVEREVPVAAVCHAPSLLIDADVVRRRTLTSWPSIRTDPSNAGATVVDEEVHVDGNLITFREPADLDASTTAFLSALGEGPLDT